MQYDFTPNPHSITDVERCLLQWKEVADRQQDDSLGAWMRAISGSSIYPLMRAVFGNSPYLSRLVLHQPALVREIEERGIDAVYERLASAPPGDVADSAALMRELREAKSRMALVIALADIAGFWGWEKVTAALSDFAEYALRVSIDHLLRVMHHRGEITLLDPEQPSQGSGLVVLGMGKLGGRELNYSSDIDLIILFEPDCLGYKGRQNEQHFMNKLAHELVTIMQERTAQGYVFRTDLRLRPDPASTPPAVNIHAAYNYYESVGQNWERAAMIKARPVAGDIAAGEKFIKNLTPFMWRRSLDFASINDIHSIKRQMDSAQNKDIQPNGHNIKLGMGGIREIEFYAQIHQLIWGGRQPVLRTRATCETLTKLVEMGLIDEEQEYVLKEAYAFLRKLEHRLQMVADQQTHSLPNDDAGVAHIACFMGYASMAEFSHALLHHLHAVHGIYASSFKGSEALGEEGNLVFTGTVHDPDTLETLRKMGYSHPETVSEIVMGWHHGSRRSTRTKRARELLTELMPMLLKRLSETANPDAAFLKFNDFLTNLPAAVQLFSLFSVNPHLLDLIADIMGSAPTLADTLSRHPDLLDAVLYEDFYGPLPSREHLQQQLDIQLAHRDDFESRMEELRRFRNEKQFQCGVQLLKRMINAQAAGQFLSALADMLIESTTAIVTEEFTAKYGTIPDSRFAIIALGKLGSREMTFSSDIDLIFVYSAHDGEQKSDGEKGFSASVYYNRFAQRLLNAVTAMGRDGRLYEVDTRLRPSGTQGLLAVSTSALRLYFEESAWTFEYMAFTKARVIYGDELIRTALDQFVIEQLMKPRDKEKLRQDVIDMRERIAKDRPTENPWSIKYVRGGLMDMDFIAQYLLLLHASGTPGARPGSATENLQWLKRSGRIPAEMADQLMAADQFMGQLFNMLRLCSDRDFHETSALPGLKKLLVESVREPDFESLQQRLIQVEREVYAQYSALLATPKEAL